MDDILNKIVINKKTELDILKSKRPLASFESKIISSTRDFKQAISKDGLSLIAEIKKASPSAGLIAEFDPVELAHTYNNHADVISIITDEKFFKGNIKYLEQINKITKLPLLRKDFIIDKYQIYEARYYGADAILLIASLLNKEQLDHFINIAKDLCMDCLVEVHNKEELDKVLDTKADIIGINNRNLKTFKVDLNTTLELLRYIPKDKLIVSESGITIDNIKKVKDKVNAVLIGTSIIKSPDIESELRKLK
jgi:indole-3-glycerol phosphate synthase